MNTVAIVTLCLPAVWGIELFGDDCKPTELARLVTCIYSALCPQHNSMTNKDILEQ